MMKVLIAYTAVYGSIFERDETVVQRKIIELDSLPTSMEDIKEIEKRELRYIRGATIFSFSVLEP